MNENSNEEKYSDKFYGSSDFDAFTWKIPNVSSIPHIVDYVVQSPSFYFGGTSWILKMYPYGQSAEGSEGYIDVTLERLHYQAENQKFFFEMFCEDIVGRKINICEIKQYTFMPGPLCTKLRFCHITRNIKDNPEKWRIAPSDIFTLVCAMRKGYESVPSESIQQNLSKRFKACRYNENPEIGKISKEYSTFTHFFAKICRVESVPAGNEIRLPFPFANASWVLKIYPYFRMENSNKKSFDVVLERLHSEIPEHHVMFEIIFMSWPDKSDKSFFFNAHHTQGDTIHFEYVNTETGKTPSNCLHFDMYMRMKRNAGPESDSQKMSIEPVEGGNSVLGSSVVLQNLKKMYLQQEDCDVIFKVKGKEFQAHRIILKAQSPVLASAFRIDMKEKATGIFEVEDCEPSIFSDFLHFLYCGEVEKLSKDNIFGLFTVADKYDILNLRVMCVEFIKKNLSIDTFCDTIALALLHSEAELVKLSTDFFTKNLQEIIVTVKWRSFIAENPIEGNELIIKALVPES